MYIDKATISIKIEPMMVTFASYNRYCIEEKKDKKKCHEFNDNHFIQLKLETNVYFKE